MGVEGGDVEGVAYGWGGGGGCGRLRGCGEQDFAEAGEGCGFWCS